MEPLKARNNNKHDLIFDETKFCLLEKRILEIENVLEKEKTQEEGTLEIKFF